MKTNTVLEVTGLVTIISLFLILSSTFALSYIRKGKARGLKMGELHRKNRYEAALLESEQRYRLIAEHSSDLIQVVNLDGVVTYASPSHRTVLGYEPSCYVGREIFYQPTSEVDTAFQQKMINIVITGVPNTCEIYRKCGDGRYIWIEINGTPVFHKNGSIEHLIIVGRDITDRKRYEEQLEHLAFHDGLTGLPNRRLFEKLLEKSIANAQRGNYQLAVMYIDCDNFKQINDTFGHTMGDNFLIQYAERLQSCIPTGDIVARLGGDEFAICLSKIECETDAKAVADQILTVSRMPWTVDEQFFSTTTSVGVAFYPVSDTDAVELMKKADLALYAAKGAGKNQYRLFAEKGCD